MRKSIKHIFLAALTVGILSACSNDFGEYYNDNQGEYRTDFGTIKGTNDNPQVLLDDNTILNIDRIGELTSWDEVNSKKADERVYINYTRPEYPVGNSVPVEYSARLIRFYSLVSKPIENRSLINADKAARLDTYTDPIEIKKAYIGGGYVNFLLLVSEFTPADETLADRIELIYDDVNYNDGDIHLKLYHKGVPAETYDPDKTVTAGASFKIPESIDLTQSNKFKLHWICYDEKTGMAAEHEDFSIFKPYASILK